MKLKVKCLKGEAFHIEVNLEQTVADVKKVIEESQKFEVDRQKLVFAGKILGDDNTLGSYGVKEGGFLVLVVSKPKNKPASASAAVSTSTPAPAAAAQTPNAPAATQAPNAALPTPTPMAGMEEGVATLTAMGFPESQALAALRAAFGDVNRAVEYLMNGIPPASASAPPSAPASAPASAPLPLPLQLKPQRMKTILLQLSATIPV